MKLIRFGSPDHGKPGLILDDGRRIDVSAFGSDYDQRLLGSNGLERLAAWAKDNSGMAAPVDASVRLGPCVARPRKIVYVGLNYTDHAKESGMPIPVEPILFFKSTSSFVGPNDDVVIPRNSRKTDWEVELGIAGLGESRQIARAFTGAGMLTQ